MVDMFQAKLVVVSNIIQVLPAVAARLREDI